MTDPARARGFRADLRKMPDAVEHMFDLVAPRYDLLNWLMTAGQVHRWRRRATALLEPRPGELVLDVAAGTGSSTAPIAAAGASAIGCDPSEAMLTLARRRHPRVPFVRGDCLDLPFEDGTFDAVTISFGLRNIGDVTRALAEVHRVCRPGGRLHVVEFSTPRAPVLRAPYRRFTTTVLPRLARLLASNPAAYTYLVESILDWPDQDGLAAAITRGGWAEVQVTDLAGGIVAVHRARRPA